MSEEHEMLHPILDPESRYYDVDAETTIEKAEKRHSVNEALAWAEMNSFYYEERAEHKEDATRDMQKRGKFEAYASLLRDMKVRADVGYLRVNDAYHMLGIKIVYKF